MTKKKRTCRRCNGNGSLKFREWSPFIGWLDLEKKCPDCKGRKVV